MSGVQINEARAPFVIFERRAVEDRESSIKAGRYIPMDVDYALITPHGSKDQIERVAVEWFDHLEKEGEQGRVPRSWAKAYREVYNDWVEGRETPLQGTPIINWPLLSPAQVRMLQDMKILTVEKLAAANEEIIGRLGMGGRDLARRAKEFLAQAEGPGKATMQITALQQTASDQAAIIAKQSEQINLLMAQMQLQQKAPQPEGREMDAHIEDIIDGKGDPQPDPNFVPNVGGLRRL